ncbi:hypothetical protein DFH09DRAFT_1073161 [Mycena vulgaris]|nr:hypothetical protein DFH09DRAFT_1073161 [Mycena vulgaris]
MAVRYFSGGLDHDEVLHSVLLREPGARSVRVREWAWKLRRGCCVEGGSLRPCREHRGRVCVREGGRMGKEWGGTEYTHPQQIPLKLFDNRRKAADPSRHVVEGRAPTVAPDGGMVMSRFWSWYMWCCTTAAAHGIRAGASRGGGARLRGAPWIVKRGRVSVHGEYGESVRKKEKFKKQRTRNCQSCDGLRQASLG